MEDKANTKPERICPHCGSDRWIASNAQRLYSRLHRKTKDAEKLAREIGLLTYQLESAQAEMREVQSLLQRKITKQARVIRRFEERLRTLKKKPYEGMGHDTAPAAEYDADLQLQGEGHRKEQL
jgi:predicted RNase H-like nuclease (RuvC/YqgF family)